ncbi:MAG TPA: hypothetical protein VKD90_20895 [Gemmataceae bacterium]|nr:hypothetical protein [Gemmataceae bacterium]
MRPVARGLHVCEVVVVEAGTSNASLVNCFTRRHAGTFPSAPMRFALYSLLSGGLGAVTMKVEISRIEDTKLVYRRSMVVLFEDRVQEVRFVLRLTDVVFPEPGIYSVVLFADDEWIAQTRLVLAV